MAAPQGTVRYHQHDRTVTFRVEGRGTMPLAMPFRRFAERLVTAGADHLRIDLRHCTHLDSTFLGTLISLRKTLAARGGRLTLVMPSESCAKIVDQMGLADLLPSDTADLDAPAEWADLPAEPEDPTSMRRNVTQAHEELAQLPGPAGEQFKAVMRCIEQSAKKDTPPE